MSDLLQALQTLPKAGAIGARLLNTDGSLQTSSVNALPTPLNQLLDSNFLRRLFPKSKLWNTYQANRPQEVEAISGACMLVKSSISKEIGGFRSEYFMYTEDMDLYRKIHQAGYKIYHAPSSRVTHHGGGSSSGHPSRFSTVMMCQALKTYMRLNHGQFAACRYQLLMLASIFSRSLPLGFAWIVAPSAKRKNRLDSLPKWLYITRWSTSNHRLHSSSPQ